MVAVTSPFTGSGVLVTSTGVGVTPFAVFCGIRDSKNPRAPKISVAAKSFANGFMFKSPFIEHFS